MDLRVKKTETSIRSAFIELRKTKPLEKITIKELTEAALINKGTFYHHYKDIYALSETLENELMEEVASVITENNLLSAKQIIYDFISVYTEHEELFKILFFGSRISRAAQKLESTVKKHIYEIRPSLTGNEVFEIRLTATIYGCFYAYLSHIGKDQEQVVSCLAQYAQDSMNMRLLQKEEYADESKISE
jgi:AcrR family transcriptional regulator